MDVTLYVSADSPSVRAGSQGDSVRALFAAGADPEVPSAPFEVLRAGSYVKGGRKIPVSEGDLDSMVSNFSRWKSEGAELPVDYDHSFAEKRGSKAAGWYQDLRREGNKLMARVRWTDAAKDAIAKREYRFFSPEFTSNWTNETGAAEGPTMLAGALTNRPFLRGKTAVAMHSEFAEQATELYTDAVAEALGVDSAPLDVTLSEMAKDEKPEQTKVEETPAKVEKPKPAEKVTATAGAEVTMTAAEVTQLRADSTKVEALSAKVESLSSQLADRDFSAIFSQAQREGRLDAKDETRDRWRECFDQLGAEKMKDLLPPAETIAVTLDGETGKGATGDPVPGDVNPEAHKLNQRVEAFAAEKGISFTDALDQLQAKGEVS